MYADCDFKYAKPSEYKEHLCTKQSLKGIFTCKECGEVFKYQQSKRNNEQEKD